MAIEVNLKKWGNSMAVIVPSEIVEKKALKENEPFFIEIVRKADVSDIFGSIKKRKMSGQKFKDIIREGWSR
jgi:antitoxin component of MazEF toxin-antitoxin module